MTDTPIDRDLVIKIDSDLRHIILSIEEIKKNQQAQWTKLDVHSQHLSAHNGQLSGHGIKHEEHDRFKDSVLKVLIGVIISILTSVGGTVLWVGHKLGLK